MLSLFKKIAERDADVRAGKWRTPDNYAYYVGSRQSDGFPGQTIGLVGFGRIGTRVAQLLAPWRARIIAYDPYVPPAHFLTHGVQSVDYETLLRESDVVSFHVVLTKETRYMFGEREIGLMKPNAIVLNTARGKVVDEKALASAIDGGPHPRRRHRRVRGGAAAGQFAAAQARRQGAALAALGLLHRRRRIAPGRRLGDALGGDRAQGRHSGQRLQPGRHPALEGALRRRERERVKKAPSAAGEPFFDRPHVGQFGVIVRPGVDGPALVGLAVADHGGEMRAAAGKQPGNRRGDRVLPQQTELVEDDQQRLV